MKSHQSLSWGLVFVLMLALLPRVAAQEPGTAPATQPADQSSPFIQAITQAADPSSAVAAYAKALLAEPDNRSAIDSAYIRRMVDLGVPEMAEAQAQDLVLRDPENALAWAVLAHCSGKREQTAAAFGQIQTAVARDPSDPFIQRTAGQLLAWYDSRPQPPEMPESIAREIPALRFKVENQLAYKQAYQLARAEYESDLAEAPPATAPIRVSRPGTDDVPQVIDPYVTYGPTAYSGPYAVPAYYPAYSYDYYRPRPWWFGSSFIIVKSFKHHHFKHDHFKHHDFKHHDFKHHDFKHHHGKFTHRLVPSHRGVAGIAHRGSLNRGRHFAGEGARTVRGGSVGQIRGPGPRVFTGPIQRSAPRSAASAAPARRPVFVGPVQSSSRGGPPARVSSGGGSRGPDRSAPRSGGGRASGGRGGRGR